MTETEEEKERNRWKNLFKKHWKMAALFVAGAVIAGIGLVLVFLWFVNRAQVLAIVPSDLASWSMAHILSFFFRMIGWELLIVGLPTGAAAIVVIGVWWSKLSEEEKEELKRDPKKKRKKITGGRSGGGFSFLTFIIFCIIVSVNGAWETAIASWAFNTLVSYWLQAFLWTLLPIGILLALGLVYLIYTLRNES
ncbi:MAG: hypothetical protein HWN66_17235 [Candidatus Helarchaeota archaeon]|nr:hypothetical protein [Candidatus Helarchaeota archaeon]